ncbi:MAG: hypothetical protein AB3N09_00085, partial [Tateyamaria sp.]
MPAFPFACIVRHPEWVRRTWLRTGTPRLAEPLKLKLARLTVAIGEKASTLNSAGGPMKNVLPIVLA